ncbi:MAG: redox-sensing transcriptional repressor Rex [Clostridia bacterium]
MSKNQNLIPEVVVRRLPRYYRLLCELEKEGKSRISSNVISTRLGITASQVRQDFSHFGAFGLQGYGYDVIYLKDEIKNILGLDKEYNVVIVGAGHIGQALANYQGFERNGIHILSVFDVKLNIEIHDVSEFREYATANKVDICVITTQFEASEEIDKIARECKIPAIWNFTHNDLQSDEHTAVENINLNESIFTLIYMLNTL